MSKSDPRFEEEETDSEDETPLQRTSSSKGLRRPSYHVPVIRLLNAMPLPRRTGSFLRSTSFVSKSDSAPEVASAPAIVPQTEPVSSRRLASPRASPRASSGAPADVNNKDAPAAAASGSSLTLGQAAVTGSADSKVRSPRRTRDAASPRTQQPLAPIAESPSPAPSSSQLPSEQQRQQQPAQSAASPCQQQQKPTSPSHAAVAAADQETEARARSPVPPSA